MPYFGLKVFWVALTLIHDKGDIDWQVCVPRSIQTQSEVRGIRTEESDPSKSRRVHQATRGGKPQLPLSASWGPELLWNCGRSEPKGWRYVLAALSAVPSRSKDLKNPNGAPAECKGHLEMCVFAHNGGRGGGGSGTGRWVASFWFPTTKRGPTILRNSHLARNPKRANTLEDGHAGCKCLPYGTLSPR